MKQTFFRQLFVVLVLSYASLGYAQSDAGNGLEFESKHLKFNATQGDDQVEAVFKFTNTSDRTVKILRVKSSCGCTVPNLEKKEYAAGESGEIKAVFTIGSRVGKQVKRIGIVTDAALNETTLTLETDIKEPVKIRPRFVLWSSDRDPKEVTITIDAEDEFAIHDIGLNNGFTYETKVADSGKLFTLFITPPPAEISARGLLNIQMKNVTRDKLLPRTGVHLRVRLPREHAGAN